MDNNPKSVFFNVNPDTSRRRGASNKRHARNTEIGGPSNNVTPERFLSGILDSFWYKDERIQNKEGKTDRT